MLASWQTHFMTSILITNGQCVKGPSIYDVHTEGEGGSGGRMWTGGREGRPHRKLKLESTDVILSSSHAKKLTSFLPEFRLWTE